MPRAQARANESKDCCEDQAALVKTPVSHPRVTTSIIPAHMQQTGQLTHPAAPLVRGRQNKVYGSRQLVVGRAPIESCTCPVVNSNNKIGRTPGGLRFCQRASAGAGR